jgi:hypothetical protein
MWTAISAFAARDLRRGPWPFVIYSGLLGGGLLLLACWLASTDSGTMMVMGIADLLAVVLLGLGLFVLVPAAVVVAVTSERRAGTLDQLRTTPTSPFELAAAFVIGAPARIYVLLLGPLALHVLASLSGLLSVPDLLRSLLVLGTGGLFLATIGLVVGLAPMRDGGGGAMAALGLAGASGIAGLICVFLTDRDTVAWSFLHPAGGLRAALAEHPGIWRAAFYSSWQLERFTEVPYTLRVALVPMASVVSSLIGAALLIGTARRRLESPQRPLLSKSQALLLFSFSAAATIAPLATFDLLSRYFARTGALVYALVLSPMAVLLALFATPSFELWSLGKRRYAHVAPWQDEASAFGLMCTMFAIAALLLAAPLHRAGFPVALKASDWKTHVWLLMILAALPLFVRHMMIRIGTVGGRIAFLVAGATYYLLQAFVVVFLQDGFERSREARLTVELGLLLGIVVPICLHFTRPRAQKESFVALVDAK